MKRSAMGLIYLIQGMQNAGVDVSSRLAQIGIQIEQLDPQVLIHRELEWQIQKHISAHLNPCMGLFIGQHYALSGYGPFLMLLLTASHVQQALKQAISFQKLTYLYGELDYDINSDFVYLIYRPVKGYENDLRTHTEISGTYKFIQDIYRLMGLPNFVIKSSLSVNRPENPQDMQAYKTYYGEDVCFGHKETVFQIDPFILSSQLLTADPIMHVVYEKKCMQEIENMRVDDMSAESTLVTKIEDYLYLQQGKIPRLEDISFALQIPERTLRHHLDQSNTSFKQIKERVLKAKAHLLLQDRKNTIESIASNLGYAETAAFNHAFKRWFGCSPKQYLLK